MRLLKVMVDGAGLFSKGKFSMDFYASDRVSRKDGLEFNDVHLLGESGSIYSQNVIAISGVNASGKSTALKTVKLVLDMLFAHASIRPGVNDSYIPARMSKSFSVRVVFWQGGEYYLLESWLHVARAVEQGEKSRWYRIDDEDLWHLDARRPNKSMLGNPDVFKANAQIYLRRNGPDEDKTVIPANARRFLLNTISIASVLMTDEELVAEDFESGTVLRTDHATDVIHAFDNSVELLKWDKAFEAFRLKFAGEDERLVGERSVLEMLSDGTIVGMEMVERALTQLRIGGFVLIDEIELALNKSLIRAFIGLFQSHATNPKGAQLIFTTHYVELLDYLPRKDNVYLLIRDRSFATEVVKYSDRISRIENKKSEVVLANAIKGAMPSYPEVEGLRAYAREYVHE